MELTIEDIENVQKQIDELKTRFETDKFKDLEKAYSEGAIIEYWSTRTEEYLDARGGMTWSKSSKYRIKDNINISSWNKHKDLIKQYWDGAEIEVYNAEWIIQSTPAWIPLFKYRVKQDKWKLPEYEDGIEWIVWGDNSISNNNSDKTYTKSGRCRATKELAIRCAKASKERDLLEAWRDHLEPKWEDTKTKAYSIKQYKQKYKISEDYDYTIGTVYGSKETMQKICDALNNKEISFD